MSTPFPSSKHFRHMLDKHKMWWESNSYEFEYTIMHEWEDGTVVSLAYIGCCDGKWSITTPPYPVKYPFDVIVLLGEIVAAFNLQHEKRNMKPYFYY